MRRLLCLYLDIQLEILITLQRKCASFDDTSTFVSRGLVLMISRNL